jgi:hypothetical protein
MFCRHLRHLNITFLFVVGFYNKYKEINCFIQDSSINPKINEIKESIPSQITNKVIELIKVIYQHIGLLEDEFWYIVYLNDTGSEKTTYQFRNYHTAESINFNFENLQELATKNEEFLTESNINKESICDNLSKELEKERDNLFNPLKPTEESYLLLRFLKNICTEFGLKYNIATLHSKQPSLLQITDISVNKFYSIPFKNTKQYKVLFWKQRF